MKFSNQKTVMFLPETYDPKRSLVFWFPGNHKLSKMLNTDSLRPGTAVWITKNIEIDVISARSMSDWFQCAHLQKVGRF